MFKLNDADEIIKYCTMYDNFIGFEFKKDDPSNIIESINNHLNKLELLPHPLVSKYNKIILFNSYIKKLPSNLDNTMISHRNLSLTYGKTLQFYLSYKNDIDNNEIDNFIKHVKFMVNNYIMTPDDIIDKE